MENLVITQASKNELDFIIETIIEADKSSTNIISACNILNVSEQEYRNILNNILNENIEGQEYSLSGFMVAKLNGISIGALGSWVEGAVGVSSYILYSNILLHYLNKEKIASILQKFKITKELSFKRETGTIQFEYAYVKEEFRRKGVYTKLMIESIKKFYPENKKISKVQGICFKANYKSLNAALKLGFEILESKISYNEELKKIFPYNEKVLLEMNKQRIDVVSKL
jgi:predicted GNAT family acetyltransferase